MHFSLDEVVHMFIPRLEVVQTFVLANKDGLVTDFCSFYHLPSTIIGNDKHNRLSAVYSYYNVATTMSIKDLMEMSLQKARDLNVDVFNALDLMENLEFLEPLKFGVGDGYLQYYLYNWKCPEMISAHVGLVLL
jgi:glycylpeptide N-tetradecanoyltransferase